MVWGRLKNIQKMPNLTIKEVTIQHVHQLWPYIEPFIVSALEHSQGEYTIEEARVFVANGQWSTVVAMDDDGIHGAALVTYYNRPRDRVAFVVAIGGKLVSNRDTWAQFEGIMRLNGATYLEGAARESIARLWSRYGMKTKYAIVGKNLNF